MRFHKENKMKISKQMKQVEVPGGARVAIRISCQIQVIIPAGIVHGYERDTSLDQSSGQ